MKKLLAMILIAVLMVSVSIPAAAAPDGKNKGTIPMTNANIVIDGVKDDVYNNGLIIKVDLNNGDAKGSGGGTSYLLWSEDGYLYIFQEFKVSGFIKPTNWELLKYGMEGTTYSWYWLLNSTEISIDFNNEGEAHTKFVAAPTDGFFYAGVQDADGTGLGIFADVDKAAYELGGPAGRYMECVTKIINDNSYTAEFKINLGAFAKDKIALRSFKEGSQLGIHFMASETNSVSYDLTKLNDDGILIFSGWNDFDLDQANYSSWETTNIEAHAEFDYVVLGGLTPATTVSEAAPEPDIIAEPEAPAAAPVVDNTPAPAAPAAPSSPKTGDENIIILAAVMIMAAASVVVYKRKISVK